MRQHTIVSVCLRINTPARESTEGGGEGIKTRCVPVRLGSCRIRRSATRHHVRNDLAAYFFHQTAFDSVPGQRVPELVAEIELAEFTAAGKIRQGAFKGLRPDKSAQDLRGEATLT